MNIDWTFRGESVDEAVQNRVNGQISRLGRFLRDPVDAHVVVAHEGPAHHRVDFELVVTSPEGTFSARGDGHDVIDVSRDVIRRVEIQAHKVHDKIRDNRRPAEPAVIAADEEE